jgi:O-antigen ligase
VLFIRLVLFYPLHIWGSSRLGTSIGYNPNVVGVEAAFAAILSLYLMEKSNRKLIYVVLFFVFLIVVVFSGSRKALLGLILGLFIIVFLRSNISIFRKIFGLIFLILFIYVFYLIMTSFEPIYDVMGRRLETLFNVFLGTESSVRTSMIDIGLSLFGEKPWIGHGQSQYSYISGFQTYSHNNYIEFLVNFGIIGFCLYYSVYVISFYRLIKIAKSHKNGIYFLSMLIVILFLETGSITYQSLYLLIPLSVVVIRSKLHHGNVHSIK